MNVNLRISDDLYEKFVALDAKNPRKVMESTLEKLGGADPSRALLVLGTKELGELSNVLGMPVSSYGDLLEWLKRTSRVSVVDVGEVSLSQGQRQRLKDLAKVMGLPYEPYVREKVQAAVTSIVGP